MQALRINLHPVVRPRKFCCLTAAMTSHAHKSGRHVNMHSSGADDGNYSQTLWFDDISYDHPFGVLLVSFFGIIIWILGYRLVKVVVVVAAFVATSLGLYFFGHKLFPNETCCNGAGKQEARISISIIGGLLAGALACYVYKIGIFCMGCCIGWFTGVVVVAIWVRKHLSSDLEFYGIYGGAGLLFGLLALWQEKIFVILVTSVAGSLAFFIGLDRVVETPFSLVLTHLFFQTRDLMNKSANSPTLVRLNMNEHLTDQCIAMFLGWLLMAAVGVILQFMYTAQDINVQLMARSCRCQGPPEESQKPSDFRGEQQVRYIKLPHHQLTPFLLHQTKREELMVDSWDEFTASRRK